MYVCLKIYTNHSLKALLTDTHQHDDLTVPRAKFVAKYVRTFIC